MHAGGRVSTLACRVFDPLSRSLSTVTTAFLSSEYVLVSGDGRVRALDLLSGRLRRIVDGCGSLTVDEPSRTAYVIVEGRSVYAMDLSSLLPERQ
jgi:hypothetical protein